MGAGSEKTGNSSLTLSQCGGKSACGGFSGGGWMGVGIYRQLWWLWYNSPFSCSKWSRSHSTTITFRLVFVEYTRCQIWTLSPCLKQRWSACWEVTVKYMAANQQSPQWCVIITLPSVALFHFHLATDLHWTMVPADSKVSLSFLHGWWTPHLSSITQHEHCNEADVCV